ncbi:hypothetical protein HVMH_1847 [Hydrogenovibrio marinus]|nr:hypothetical protein HVMH_1847 [Hydrogenovibrio marinus]
MAAKREILLTSSFPMDTDKTPHNKRTNTKECTPKISLKKIPIKLPHFGFSKKRQLLFSIKKSDIKW